jgi:perosamine synthetase
MIHYGRHHLDEDDIEAVVQQMRTRTLTQGAAIEEFEHAIAEYVSARFAVAVSSGTAALHLACLAAKLKPDDVVLTSAVSFVASANCALYAGARPGFVDVEPQSANMAPADLERRCAGERNVRVVIPVHFAGLPAQMDAIRSIARRAGALVVEDASHALGSRYADGKPVGCCAASDMTVFSFHPVKSITCGEGGMITTNDQRLYRELLRLRSHGINKGNDPFLCPEQAVTDGEANRWYYEMQELGFNYRLTEIQAALGTSQLRKIEKFIERRQVLAQRYNREFASTAWRTRGVRPLEVDGRHRSARHLYVVRAPFGSSIPTRNAVMKGLFSRGIVSQVHYMPIPMHPMYRKLGFRPEEFPAAMEYYAECLSIPLYYDLSDEQQTAVLRALSEVMQ